ncbi:MAG: (Fe-S)-binding protein [Planctomycetota bacterium]|jgi:L-lactate dehydrogenase complex protein LldE
MPGRKVMLMATCLCDAFYDHVARATVEVLEHLGCDVILPEDQTCCGQPAFTAGDRTACRRALLHTAEVFDGDLPVVAPSGSCATLLRHKAALIDPAPEVAALARRTRELCDYIVHELGTTSWPGRYEARAVLHRPCHTRGTAILPAVERLLGSVEGLELLEFDEPEQCCGFGGVFAVAFPHLAASIGGLKLDHLLAGRPDCVVSPDMSCLLHLHGLARRQQRSLPGLHVAQVLRRALENQ